MKNNQDAIAAFKSSFDRVAAAAMTPLDLLPRRNLIEKLVELELHGPPQASTAEAKNALAELARSLRAVPVSSLKAVVLGGGTGLSNLIGGDSRQELWPLSPFRGLKEYFSELQAVVCITDDGGSTGELLKDLPLFALGDLRHVLLSSIQKSRLQQKYRLADADAVEVARVLYNLFNYRFTVTPVSATALLKSAAPGFAELPGPMRQGLSELIELLFADNRLRITLGRPHCLGNLILAASIIRQAVAPLVTVDAVATGMGVLADFLGVVGNGVLPCTITPAKLKMLYSNGVMVTGEHKAGHARRGYPVDRVFVEFTHEPQIMPEVLAAIRGADLIIMAPGSLYTSIIPILQVPGLAGAIRENQRALKVLVTNLWIQKGETDLVREEPGRRFYVSDLIRAYHRNIPEGIGGLFSKVLSISLRDIPGSILQSYAIEDKVPIYLDRDEVKKLGLDPVEAGIFSLEALQERRVVQHDPDAMARAIRSLWVVGAAGLAGGAVQPGGTDAVNMMPASFSPSKTLVKPYSQFFSERYQELQERAHRLEISIESTAGIDPKELRQMLVDILWRHPDVPLAHLDRIDGLVLVNREEWLRCQQWDNVYSFYETTERQIRIRQDLYHRPERFEVALLVTLGQALLGNYAAAKETVPLDLSGESIGKCYKLTLQPLEHRDTFFSDAELDRYLGLVRMIRSRSNRLLYTRLINGNEGFTPPGLLIGLIYAWYLDNRFTAHIEYKMSIMRNEISNLIPEQVKMYSRRRAIIEFFREVVFQHDPAVFSRKNAG